MNGRGRVSLVGSDILGRRSGGLFHGEVTKGPGGTEQATTRSCKRGERLEERGGGAAVDENRNEMMDRLARYRFD